MPKGQADVDPSDVDGIPLGEDEINQSGDDHGSANLAKALGVDDENTDDELDDEDEDDEDDEGDDEEDDEDDDANESQNKKGKGKSGKDKSKKPNDPHNIAEGYAETVQRNAEEAYASTLFRAQNEEGYLEKLVADKNPIAQRLAKKIIERNPDLADGAKTLEEFKSNARKKAIGDDPTKLHQAQTEDRLEQLEQRENQREWRSWKRENAVRGEAEKHADDIHARYPDMPPSEVMEMVKGKMGASYRESQKDKTSAAHGGGAPADQSDFGISGANQSLVKALLPNAKKTVKFGKKYLKGLR